jgi:hypothetical protein
MKETYIHTQLINAAPDLLEACKFALEQFMNIEQSELFDPFVIQQLSDAIQKAEGGKS